MGFAGIVGSVLLPFWATVKINGETFLIIRMGSARSNQQITQIGKTTCFPTTTLLMTRKVLPTRRSAEFNGGNYRYFNYTHRGRLIELNRKLAWGTQPLIEKLLTQEEMVRGREKQQTWV